MKIKVFYHVNELTGAFDLMGEQLSLASESGLLDTIDEFYICINGVNDNFNGAREVMKPYANVKFVHVANDAKQCEYPTLNFMHKTVKEDDTDCVIGYFHLKGLTRLNDPNVIDWRDYLDYWTIEKWAISVEKIKEGYDLVGTNIIEKPWLHSSGNFWWSRAKYIRVLNELVSPSNIPWGTVSPYTGAVYDIGNFRYDHEAWIGSKNPNFFEIDCTPGKAEPGWHFRNRYSRENYVK